MCELCEEEVEKLRKELIELGLSEEQIEKSCNELRQKLNALDIEYNDVPLWYQWYVKHWLKPKVEKLNPEYYKLSKKNLAKLEDDAHNWLMENKLDEILASMPEKLRQQYEQIYQNTSKPSIKTEDVYQPKGIWKTCLQCGKEFRARRRVQKYCSQDCYRQYVSNLYAKD